MNKIKKVSSTVVILLTLAIIIYPILSLEPLIRSYGFNLNYPESWLVTNHATIKTIHGEMNLYEHSLPLISKLIISFASIMTLSPTIFIFYYLRKIFCNYKKGNIFTLSNSKYYRNIGWILIVESLIIFPIYNALTSLAVTLPNLPGKRVVQVSFGTDNFGYIIIGLMIIVISWVMMEANKLEEDHKFTV
jgi:hypothetical protein